MIHTIPVFKNSLNISFKLLLCHHLSVSHGYSQLFFKTLTLLSPSFFIKVTFSRQAMAMAMKRVQKWAIEASTCRIYSQYQAANCHNPYISPNHLKSNDSTNLCSSNHSPFVFNSNQSSPSLLTSNHRNLSSFSEYSYYLPCLFSGSTLTKCGSQRHDHGSSSTLTNPVSSVYATFQKTFFFSESKFLSSEPLQTSNSSLVEGCQEEQLSSSPGLGQQLEKRRKMKAYPLGVELRNHHGVYFAGYVLPTPNDETRFVETWEKVAASRSTHKSSLYQELARKQPWEPSLRRKEGQYRYDFVEYSVFDSMEGLHKAAEDEDWKQGQEDLKEFQPDGEKAAGFYDVTIRVAKEEPREQELVVYNLFEVKGKQTADFLAAISWPKRVEFESSQTGFLSAVLHRTADEQRRFIVFDRTEWRNQEAFIKAEQRMEDNFPLVPHERQDSLKFHPGLFTIVRRKDAVEDEFQETVL